MRKLSILGLILGLLVACQAEETPLPTALNPEALASQRAADRSATAIQEATLSTYTPTPSQTPTLPPSPSPSPEPSQTPSPSPSPTRFPSATVTPTNTPLVVQISLTPSPTLTLTPSLTPTRINDPDALLRRASALRAQPNLTASAVTELPAGTALEIESRSADDLWLKVRLIDGLGGGWVSIDDILVLISLQSIPVESSAPSTTGATRLLAPPPTLSPLSVTGTGAPFLPYDFATCGDTYWLGDSLGYSMENLAAGGRYPRFAANPIRVYVHGLANRADVEEWELAISLAFAELSQALRLERVLESNLDFFQPFVPLQTLYLDNEVDTVWHVMEPATYQAQAPCDDPLSCGTYSYDGVLLGGFFRFGSMAYLRADAPDKKMALLTAAIPALGLGVQSARADDVMGQNSHATRLSARDVRTLRCLYNAPPYGTP